MCCYFSFSSLGGQVAIVITTKKFPIPSLECKTQHLEGTAYIYKCTVRRGLLALIDGKGIKSLDICFILYLQHLSGTLQR